MDMKCFTEYELEELLQAAAKRGAREALHELGLNDDKAPSDIRDLRSLLDAIRTAKNTALKSAIQFLTVLAMGALLVGIAVKYKVMGQP